MKFSELGLSQDILDAITTHGYVEATPIQEKTIPLTLAGRMLLDKHKQELVKQLLLVCQSWSTLI